MTAQRHLRGSAVPTPQRDVASWRVDVSALGHVTPEVRSFEQIARPLYRDSHVEAQYRLVMSAVSERQQAARLLLALYAKYKRRGGDPSPSAIRTMQRAKTEYARAHDHLAIALRVFRAVRPRTADCQFVNQSADRAIYAEIFAELA